MAPFYQETDQGLRPLPSGRTHLLDASTTFYQGTKDPDNQITLDFLDIQIEGRSDGKLTRVESRVSRPQIKGIPEETLIIRRGVGEQAKVLSLVYKKPIDQVIAEKLAEEKKERYTPITDELTKDVARRFSKPVEKITWTDCGIIGAIQFCRPFVWFYELAISLPVRIKDLKKGYWQERRNAVRR